MARTTIEICTCDVCERRIDTPYRGGEAGTYSLQVNADYAVAGYNSHWKDLCQDCNGWLGGWINDLQAAAKQRRLDAKEQKDD